MVMIAFASGCAGVNNHAVPALANRDSMATVIESSMKKDLLDRWYPRSVDSMNGGFISAYHFDFTQAANQEKMIVTQSRHVWSNAIAARWYPNESHFKSSAQQGFNFLKQRMWDSEFGGFYTLVDQQGNVKDANNKMTYGNAFGIYASAAWYKTSGDSNALNLAKECFAWLEKHCHDSLHKGYYQHLQRDGQPIKRTDKIPSTSDLGYKDQNSSIHLLEAFTELYEVWPDSLVKQRLLEMLLLIRDVITNEKGSLVLFFKPDWSPVSFRDSTRESILKHRYLDHVSFGHDIETAYLMLEASQIAGITNDSTTMRIAKKMVDHSLLTGWDSSNGGFYDEGYYFKDSAGITITKKTKNWWAQAEALNTLLMMADLYPSDPMNYYNKFLQQWKYIDTYLIDHQYGDWYDEGLDTSPNANQHLKGHIWKATYHQLRALANCVKRLRNQTHSN